MENLIKKAKTKSRFGIILFFYKIVWFACFIFLVFIDEKGLLKEKGYHIGDILVISFIVLVVAQLCMFFSNLKFHSGTKMKHGLFVFRGYKGNEDDFIDVYGLRRDAFIVCFLEIFEILFCFLPILPIDMIFKIKFMCKLRKIKKRVCPVVKENKEGEDETGEEYDGDNEEQEEETPMFENNTSSIESNETRY